MHDDNAKGAFRGERAEDARLSHAGSQEQGELT